MKSFTIGANDANQRVDKFITKAVPLLPKGLMQKYIRTKRIKLGGKRCNPDDKLTEGDILELYINDEFFVQSTEAPSFLEAPTQLDIVYEDQNILLIDKKPGLIVHSDNRGQSDTLIDRVLHYLYDKKEYMPENENSFAPALCNRIDQYTGGIVIAAKNAQALRDVNELLRERKILKLYLCLVHGIPKKKSDILRGYLTKDGNENKVQILPQRTEGSLAVLTRYTVVKEYSHHALLEVDLQTGRSHQIRAHLSTIGHPICGDTKYGAGEFGKLQGIYHQALYAYKIVFSDQLGDCTLSYLAGKSFEVKKVYFKDIVR